MKQSERDPIDIRIADPLDDRFADLYFSAGNGPRDSDNSISIDGHVDFGERNQIVDGQPRYRIGIRGAFLKINAVDCNFEPNGQREVRLQEGAIAESHKANTSQNSKASLSAAAKAKLGGMTSDASTNGSAAISSDRSSAAVRKSEQKYQIYRVRWLAGGWRFGDPTRGDAYEPDGVLRGRYLEGAWGRLMPHRGETQYGARFTLLVQKGNLFVERLAASVRDLIPFKPSPEDRAFEALKNEVSAWYLKQQLTGLAHGFDKERAELVLAQGEVSVNLGALEAPEVEEKSDNLVEGQATLALPPPSIATSAQTVGKRKRAQKSVQKNG